MLNDPRIWGTHLKWREVVMMSSFWFLSQQSVLSGIQCEEVQKLTLYNSETVSPFQSALHCKLQKDSCHLVHASLYTHCIVFLFILFPFSFICVQIGHEILSQKVPFYRLFSLITGHGTKKCY